ARRLRRRARDPPDHRRGPAARFPARRVRAGEGLRGPHRPPQADARRGLAPAGILLALDARLRGARLGQPAPPVEHAPRRGRQDRNEAIAVSVRLQEALEALYGLERRKDKLGLEGTRALLGALGNPERRFPSVHVAGTNGKGTACALIERVLRAAGHRTG